MNSIFLAPTFVLAHGLDVSPGEGIFILIIMLFLILGAFYLRKKQMFKSLFFSFVFPYILVFLTILQISFNIEVPKIIESLSSRAIEIWPYSLIFILGINSGILIMEFIIYSAIIFALVTLILFIKHKIMDRKLIEKN